MGGHWTACVGGGTGWESSTFDRAGFIIKGANWALNFEKFREFAPKVDLEVLQTLLLDA